MGFMDEQGDLKFHHIFEWMLQKFGDGKTFYQCMATRMRNYMVGSIRTKGWTPKFYNPVWGVNMVGMMQPNCVGANVTNHISKMKKEMLRVCAGSTRCGRSALQHGRTTQ